MIALLIALAGQGQAAPLTAPVPAAPVGAAMSTQQQFDAASAAALAGQCTEAIRTFHVLETTPAYRRNRLFAAAVDVRKGGCLIRTGHAGEGKAAINRGLPTLAAQTGGFENDLSIANLALGDEATQRFDYTEAALRYRAAADVVNGTSRIVPLMRLSQVTMFDRDGRAHAAADEARNIAATSPDYAKKDLAIVQSQYARVLLNEGQPAEAYKVLKDSVAKQGGLTNRVGLNDIIVRSDLAIAAIQSKRPEDASLYLAYTGAGRLEDTPFRRTAIMNPPTCGEGGTSPDDMAIVEFSIASDGRVTDVTPIYTTGGRQAAVAFARAVRDWSWRAEAIRDVPALLRSATRVELRCSKAVTGKGITAPLSKAAAAWFDERDGSPPWADLSDAAALPIQRAALHEATAGGNPTGMARAALALGNSSVVSAEESAKLLDMAAKAAADAAAPTSVRNFIAIRRSSVDDGSVEKKRNRLRAMLAHPDVAADPLSASTVRLLISQPAFKTPPPDDAATLQAAVADDPALPANHPLKVAALLGQANVLASKGNLAAARAAFDRTGMTGEQCSQLGLTPNLRSIHASSSDYPMHASRMGFEGWVVTEADVTADGRPAIQRTIVAYPPFIFDEAATAIVKDARFSSSFRPEGTLACEGVPVSISFSTPE